MVFNNFLFSFQHLQWLHLWRTIYEFIRKKSIDIFFLFKWFIDFGFLFFYFCSGERPYLCSICGKGFTQNSNLRQHLMRHNQNKPFKCVKCSANFVSKGELISHNRTHTGDHPFTCEVCNSGFTTSSSLVISEQILIQSSQIENEIFYGQF